MALWIDCILDGEKASLSYFVGDGVEASFVQMFAIALEEAADADVCVNPYRCFYVAVCFGRNPGRRTVFSVTTGAGSMYSVTTDVGSMMMFVRDVGRCSL